ncbi:hypothetical protein NHJ13734_008720 [Beauveria thailandica]
MGNARPHGKFLSKHRVVDNRTKKLVAKRVWIFASLTTLLFLAGGDEAWIGATACAGRRV